MLEADNVSKEYTLEIMYPCRDATAARNSESLAAFNKWKTVDYNNMLSDTTRLEYDPSEFWTVTIPKNTEFEAAGGSCSRTNLEMKITKILDPAGNTHPETSSLVPESEIHAYW